MAQASIISDDEIKRRSERRTKAKPCYRKRNRLTVGFGELTDDQLLERIQALRTRKELKELMMMTFEEGDRDKYVVLDFNNIVKKLPEHHTIEMMFVSGTTTMKEAYKKAKFCYDFILCAFNLEVWRRGFEVEDLCRIVMREIVPVVQGEDEEDDDDNVDNNDENNDGGDHGH